MHYPADSCGRFQVVYHVASFELIRRFRLTFILSLLSIYQNVIPHDLVHGKQGNQPRQSGLGPLIGIDANRLNAVTTAACLQIADLLAEVVIAQKPAQVSLGLFKPFHLSG